MLRKLLVVSTSLLFAFAIILISVLKTASVRYEFNKNLMGSDLSTFGFESVIDYTLPYPGNVLPDSPFWGLKALRDRVWLTITTDKLKKVELLLLFSDKRLASAIELFEKKEPSVAFSTISKAEKYLIQADEVLDQFVEPSCKDDLCYRVALSALKHYETLELLKTIAPEDARPSMNELQKIAVKVYEKERDRLYSQGIEPPKNPFDWK